MGGRFLSNTKKTRTVALIMALVMIVTLFPIAAPYEFASANSSNIIINYGSGDAGKTKENYLLVHNNKYNVTGTYYSLATPQELRYRVENVSTGEQYSSTMPPEIMQNSTFRFQEIDLFIGLNEVRVSYVSGSTVYNSSIFIYYNNTPILADLKIQGVEINSDENIISVPLHSDSNIAYVDISGLVFNADELTFRNKSLMGITADAELSFQVSPFTNNFFNIIPLRAGVNQLEFIAKNSFGKKIKIERTVILNTLTSDGLSVINLQSTHMDDTATSSINYIPFNGEVDIKKDSQANYQGTFAVEELANEHFAFTGRIIIDTGDYLAFSDSKTVTINDVAETLKSDITFNILKDGIAVIPEEISLQELLDLGVPFTTANTTGTAIVTNQDGLDIVEFLLVIEQDVFRTGTNWSYGNYTMELTPHLYNNIAESPFLVLDGNAKLQYPFMFVDLEKPRISGISVVSTGEYILEHNEPYLINQDAMELYIHHDNIAEGETLAYEIQQAPYQYPPANTQAANRTTFLASGGNFTPIQLKNLPTGNVLFTVYKEGEKGTTKLYKRFVVAVSPSVTLLDGKVNYVTANKEYIYTEKGATITKETFMQENFNNMKMGIRSISSSTIDPISIRVNGTALAPAAIVVTDVVGGKDIALNLYNTGLLQENILNRVHVSFKDGNITVESEFTFFIITEGAPVIEPFRVRLDGQTNFNAHPFGDLIMTDKERTSVRVAVDNVDRATLFVNGEIVSEYTYNGTSWSSAAGNASSFYDYQLTFSDTGSSREIRLEQLVLKYKGEAQIDIYQVRVEVQKGTTTVSQYIVFERIREIYTVLAPFRSVVNQNFQTFIIKAPHAETVRIGRTDAMKVKTDRNSDISNYVMDYITTRLYGPNEVSMQDLGGHVFYAEIPLKAGENKISFTVIQNEITYTGQHSVFYAATLNEGAVFKTNISGGRINPRELGNGISLTFPRNTLLSPKSSRLEGFMTPYVLPDFWHDKQILIGVAHKYSGKVDRDIPATNNTLRQMLVGSPNALDYYNYASELYYIDAGTINRPGGRLPFEGSMVTSKRERDVLVPNKRGTLTMKYDANIVMDASSHLTVMYHPGYAIDGQTAWRNLGGVVNTRSKEITVPFDDFGYYVVMKLRRSFDDVTSHGWARKHIEAMYSKGIMASETPERFNTDRPITRGEFVTILVKALALKINDAPYSSEGIVKSPTRPTFDDVRPNIGLPFWDYKYIETAARAGIIQGISPRRFAPNQLLTREQAAVMIARATEARMARTPEIALSQIQGQYVDADNIEYYALQSVAAISRTGIITGNRRVTNEGIEYFDFMPKNNLTRAEASVIATRLMQQLKLLPDPL